MKKICKPLFFLLAFVLFFAIGSTKASAAEVSKTEEIIAPMIATHYETYYVKKPRTKTYDLKVKLYGTNLYKGVGQLVVNYTTEWYETWLCDNAGNKLSLETTYGVKIITSTVNRDFNLKLYTSFSETIYDISTSSIRLSGSLLYEPPIGVGTKGSDSYDYVITAQAF